MLFLYHNTQKYIISSFSCIILEEGENYDDDGYLHKTQAIDHELLVVGEKTD